MYYCQELIEVILKDEWLYLSFCDGRLVKIFMF